MEREVRKLRLLLVEDDAILRRTVVRLLRGTFAMTAVENGSEALSSLTRGFDIVLTDYNLPDINGLDLLAQIRLADPNVFRAITSSPCWCPVDELTAGNLVQAFLPKPVERVALLELQRVARRASLPPERS